MTIRHLVLVLTLTAFMPAAALLAQAPTGEAAVHVETARVAAGTDHVAFFDRVCAPPPPLPAPAPAVQAAAPPTVLPVPPRESWYADPVKVFDNLYWVGQTEYSAWAVDTSDGIIVIDPLFEYSVEVSVAEGLEQLGLDPARIRYVVVSHGHRDHAGGASFLQDTFDARVVLTEADWELLETDTGAWPKPTRDIVATDGFELTLGDTTLTLWFTPGHTLGTLATVLRVRNGTDQHTALLYGGTAFNWQSGSPRYITPERPASFWYASYAESARKLRQLAADLGVDVLLSNHPDYDGSPDKLPRMAGYVPGQPHPYVIGAESVQRFLTVGEQCALAGPLW
jgi:metallo-beta-lactamase class B